MNEEQKKLADQMVLDIQVEVENDLKAEKGETVVAQEVKPNPLVDGILEWGKQLDLDNVKPNSVLMIKVNSEEPSYAYKFQVGVVKHVLEPRFSALKEKKVTVLFLSDKDDISVLTESDMEKAGWYKKEKTLIINPFDK